MSSLTHIRLLFLTRGNVVRNIVSFEDKFSYKKERARFRRHDNK